MKSFGGGLPEDEKEEESPSRVSSYEFECVADCLDIGQYKLYQGLR